MDWVCVNPPESRRLRERVKNAYSWAPPWSTESDPCWGGRGDKRLPCNTPPLTAVMTATHPGSTFGSWLHGSPSVTVNLSEWDAATLDIQDPELNYM